MNHKVSIVVVVPYYNEVSSLPYLLNQILRQTHQPDRVVLVDSCSSDDSPNLVDNWIFSNQIGGTFTNLRLGTKTPGGSKAAGIRESSEELIAFMDCGLTFPIDWLEQQLKALDESGADWVSGVNQTEGLTISDKAAIAHTIGYRRARPAIPSSIIPRSLFNLIGPFKDLRAGYDVEWVHLASRKGFRRHVNHQVVVTYHDVNYAEDSVRVFRKSREYARPSVFRARNPAPYVYLFGAIGALGLAITAPLSVLFLSTGYLLLRLLIAARKSRGSITYFLSSPKRLGTLLLVGAAIDAGKLWGFLDGLSQRWLRRRSQPIHKPK